MSKRSHAIVEEIDETNAKRVQLDFVADDDSDDNDSAQPQFARLRRLHSAQNVVGRLVDTSAEQTRVAPASAIGVQLEVAPDVHSHARAVDAVLHAVVPGYAQRLDHRTAIEHTLEDINTVCMEYSDCDTSASACDSDGDCDCSDDDDDDESSTLGGFVVPDKGKAARRRYVIPIIHPRQYRLASANRGYREDDDDDGNALTAGNIPTLQNDKCFSLVATYVMCCALDSSYTRSLLDSTAGVVMLGPQARHIWEQPAYLAESVVATGAWRPGVRELLLRHCLFRTRRASHSECMEKCSVCQVSGHVPEYAVELFGVCPSSRDVSRPEYDGTFIRKDVEALNALLESKNDGDDLPVDMQRSTTILCGSTCFRRARAYSNLVHLWKRLALFCYVTFGGEGLDWRAVSRRVMGSGDDPDDQLAIFAGNCKRLYRKTLAQADIMCTFADADDAADSVDGCDVW